MSLGNAIIEMIICAVLVALFESRIAFIVMIGYGLVAVILVAKMVWAAF